MPPEHDVTHTDIYVRLAELGGKIDLLGQLMTERNRTVEDVRTDVNELFKRMRNVENHKIQVIAIAGSAILIIPIISSWLQPRLTFPTAIEQQENHK